MPELRKLLRLAKNAYAVSIPAKYRKTIGFKFGDYVSIHLLDSKTLGIKKEKAPEKI